MDTGNRRLRWWGSFVALTLALSSLGGAVWLDQIKTEADKEDARLLDEHEKAERARRARVTVKIGDFDLHLGEKKKPANALPHEPQRVDRSDQRTLQVTTVALAVAAIGLAALSYASRRQAGLCVAAVAGAIAALAWPYVSMGIGVAVGIVVLLLVLSILAAVMG
jgi:hypothetical protein